MKKQAEELSYAIWIVEKEFNVGWITEDTLLLSFWNLFDDENIKRYNQSMKGDTKDIKTLGR